MPRQSYIETLLREFRRLKQLADRAMAQVNGEGFFARPTPAVNSIAIIVKHMAGNMHSRWRDFLTSDGEKPDRNRDREFILDASDTRQSLSSRWEAGWKLLFDTFGVLGDDDLERVVKIRGESHTVFQAASRQLTHYAYHVGQIVFIARQIVGDDWETLSVPLGESERFNLDPKRYLGERDV
jgi:hypothetical protein